MTVTTSSLLSATSPAVPSTAALSTAVSGSVKTDITKALTAAGLGAYASSQQASDLIGKISQDAVSALQSPGSQGAAASLSKVLTSDIGSVLNQYGMGAYASSSQMTDLTKGLTSDVMSAAQSAGYSETITSTPETTEPATSAVTSNSSAASTNVPSASTFAASEASTAATSATAPTASSASASTLSAADTVASILKAIQPLTGTGANASSLVGRLADAFNRSHVSGEVGTIMSSVATSLQQTQAATTAAAKASSASASDTTPSATTTSTASTAASSSATVTTPSVSSASLTSAQSASATLASMLAQNESSLNSITSGMSSSVSFGLSSMKNPLALAYAAV